LALTQVSNEKSLLMGGRRKAAELGDVMHIINYYVDMPNNLIMYLVKLPPTRLTQAKFS
jgi:hypothetical protein